MLLPTLPTLLLTVGVALAPVGAQAMSDQTVALAAADSQGEGAQALDPAPDDRELTDFVSAFMRLIGVQHGYMMMMSEEADPARVEELKTQAVNDMEEAIQKDGMSVDRYNTIALAIREDPALQDRVEGILQQLAETPAVEQ